MIRAVLIALGAGTLFGIGLTASAMVDPARVRGFLDLFGNWDPTLMFVMGGAIVPMALAWMVQRRMAQPAAADRFYLPATDKLDGRLMGGSVLFGIGWGIAGLCPGPALATLALAPANAVIFAVAMLTGMALFMGFDRYGGAAKGSPGPASSGPA